MKYVILISLVLWFLILFPTIKIGNEFWPFRLKTACERARESIADENKYRAVARLIQIEPDKCWKD